ncbi:MAG: LON peptidase substrate-binding domain-containing protein [Nitrospinota bacterium]
MSGALLPLFPLEVVLFPHALLPLHIFEERYKQMIGECLKGGGPFGVVLCRGGERHEVGCSAEVSRLLRRFPDGRMNILTEGGRRFRLERPVEGTPYLRGEVEFFDDLPELPDPELVRKAGALYREVLRRSGLPTPTNAPFLDNPARLSFAIAANSTLSLEEKQGILEMRSPTRRLERLTAWLEEHLRGVVLAERRQRARKNGFPR